MARGGCGPGQAGRVLVQGRVSRDRPSARRPRGAFHASEGGLEQLFEEGRVDYHPVFPGRPGMGARTIETDDDVEDVIALMRLNYKRVVERHGLPAVGSRGR